jgi:hypothetical protein
LLKNALRENYLGMIEVEAEGGLGEDGDDSLGPASLNFLPSSLTAGLK